MPDSLTDYERQHIIQVTAPKHANPVESVFVYLKMNFSEFLTLTHLANR